MGVIKAINQNPQGKPQEGFLPAAAVSTAAESIPVKFPPNQKEKQENLRENYLRQEGERLEKLGVWGRLKERTWDAAKTLTCNCAELLGLVGVSILGQAGRGVEKIGIEVFKENDNYLDYQAKEIENIKKFYDEVSPNGSILSNKENSPLSADKSLAANLWNSAKLGFGLVTYPTTLLINTALGVLTTAFEEIDRKIKKQNYAEYLKDIEENPSTIRDSLNLLTFISLSVLTAGRAKVPTPMLIRSLRVLQVMVPSLGMGTAGALGEQLMRVENAKEGGFNTRKLISDAIQGALASSIFMYGMKGIKSIAYREFADMSDGASDLFETFEETKRVELQNTELSTQAKIARSIGFGLKFATAAYDIKDTSILAKKIEIDNDNKNEKHNSETQADPFRLADAFLRNETVLTFTVSYSVVLPPSANSVEAYLPTLEGKRRAMQLQEVGFDDESSSRNSRIRNPWKDSSPLGRGKVSHAMSGEVFGLLGGTLNAGNPFAVSQNQAKIEVKQFGEDGIKGFENLDFGKVVEKIKSIGIINSKEIDRFVSLIRRTYEQKRDSEIVFRCVVYINDQPTYLIAENRSNLNVRYLFRYPVIISPNILLEHALIILFSGWIGSTPLGPSYYAPGCLYHLKYTSSKKQIVVNEIQSSVSNHNLRQLKKFLQLKIVLIIFNNLLNSKTDKIEFGSLSKEDWKVIFEVLKQSLGSLKKEQIDFLSRFKNKVLQNKIVLLTKDDQSIIEEFVKTLDLDLHVIHSRLETRGTRSLVLEFILKCNLQEVVALLSFVSKFLNEESRLYALASRDLIPILIKDLFARPIVRFVVRNDQRNQKIRNPLNENGELDITGKDSLMAIIETGVKLGYNLENVVYRDSRVFVSNFSIQFSKPIGIESRPKQYFPDELSARKAARREISLFPDDGNTSQFNDPLNIFQSSLGRGARFMDGETIGGPFNAKLDDPKIEIVPFTQGDETNFSDLKFTSIINELRAIRDLSFLYDEIRGIYTQTAYLSHLELFPIKIEFKKIVYVNDEPTFLIGEKDNRRILFRYPKKISDIEYSLEDVELLACLGFISSQICGPSEYYPSSLYLLGCKSSGEHINITELQAAISMTNARLVKSCLRLNLAARFFTDLLSEVINPENQISKIPQEDVREIFSVIGPSLKEMLLPENLKYFEVFKNKLLQDINVLSDIENRDLLEEFLRNTIHIINLEIQIILDMLRRVQVRLPVINFLSSGKLDIKTLKKFYDLIAQLVAKDNKLFVLGNEMLASILVDDLFSSGATSVFLPLPPTDKNPLKVEIQNKDAIMAVVKAALRAGYVCDNIIIAADGKIFADRDGISFYRQDKAEKFRESKNRKYLHASSFEAIEEAYIEFLKNSTGIKDKSEANLKRKAKGVYAFFNNNTNPKQFIVPEASLFLPDRKGRMAKAVLVKHETLHEEIEKAGELKTADGRTIILPPVGERSVELNKMIEQEIWWRCEQFLRNRPDFRALKTDREPLTLKDVFPRISLSRNPKNYVDIGKWVGRVYSGNEHFAARGEELDFERESSLENNIILEIGSEPQATTENNPSLDNSHSCIVSDLIAEDLLDQALLHPNFIASAQEAGFDVNHLVELGKLVQERKAKGENVFLYKVDFDGKVEAIFFAEEVLDETNGKCVKVEYVGTTAEHRALDINSLWLRFVEDYGQTYLDQGGLVPIIGHFVKDNKHAFFSYLAETLAGSFVDYDFNEVDNGEEVRQGNSLQAVRFFPIKKGDVTKESSVAPVTTLQVSIGTGFSYDYINALSEVALISVQAVFDESIKTPVQAARKTLEDLKSSPLALYEDYCRSVGRGAALEKCDAQKLNELNELIIEANKLINSISEETTDTEVMRIWNEIIELVVRAEVMVRGTNDLGAHKIEVVEEEVGQVDSPTGAMVAEVWLKFLSGRDKFLGELPILLKKHQISEADLVIIKEFLISQAFETATQEYYIQGIKTVDYLDWLKTTLKSAGLKNLRFGLIAFTLREKLEERFFKAKFDEKESLADSIKDLERPVEQLQIQEREDAITTNNPSANFEAKTIVPIIITDGQSPVPSGALSLQYFDATNWDENQARNSLAANISSKINHILRLTKFPKRILKNVGNSNDRIYSRLETVLYFIFDVGLANFKSQIEIREISATGNSSICFVDIIDPPKSAAMNPLRLGIKLAASYPSFDGNELSHLLDLQQDSRFKHASPFVVAGCREFLIMEAISGLNGQEISTLIREMPEDSSSEEKLAIILELALKEAAVLNIIHEAGKVHADIKPPNFMLRINGSLVILDFAASRNLVKSFDKVKINTGTDLYAAPEQVLKSEGGGPMPNRYIEASKASDVFSFGCCLYELFSFAGSPFWDEICKIRFPSREDNYLSRNDRSELTIEEVEEAIRKNCQPQFYSLLIEMLNPNPVLRPNIEQVLKKLQKLKPVIDQDPSFFLAQICHDAFASKENENRKWLQRIICGERGYIEARADGGLCLTFAYQYNPEDGGLRNGIKTVKLDAATVLKFSMQVESAEVIIEILSNDDPEYTTQKVTLDKIEGANMLQTFAHFAAKQIRAEETVVMQLAEQANDTTSPEYHLRRIKEIAELSQEHFNQLWANVVSTGVTEGNVRNVLCYEAGQAQCLSVDSKNSGTAILPLNPQEQIKTFIVLAREIISADDLESILEGKRDDCLLMENVNNVAERVFCARIVFYKLFLAAFRNTEVAAELDEMWREQLTIEDSWEKLVRLLNLFGCNRLEEIAFYTSTNLLEVFAKSDVTPNDFEQLDISFVDINQPSSFFSRDTAVKYFSINSLEIEIGDFETLRAGLLRAVNTDIGNILQSHIGLGSIPAWLNFGIIDYYPPYLYRAAATNINDTISMLAKEVGQALTVIDFGSGIGTIWGEILDTNKNIASLHLTSLSSFFDPAVVADNRVKTHLCSFATALSDESLPEAHLIYSIYADKKMPRTALEVVLQKLLPGGVAIIEFSEDIDKSFTLAELNQLMFSHPEIEIVYHHFTEAEINGMPQNNSITFLGIDTIQIRKKKLAEITFPNCVAEPKGNISYSQETLYALEDMFRILEEDHSEAVDRLRSFVGKGAKILPLEQIRAMLGDPKIRALEFRKDAEGIRLLNEFNNLMRRLIYNQDSLSLEVDVESGDLDHFFEIDYNHIRFGYFDDVGDGRNEMLGAVEIQVTRDFIYLNETAVVQQRRKDVTMPLHLVAFYHAIKRLLFLNNFKSGEINFDFTMISKLDTSFNFLPKIITILRSILGCLGFNEINCEIIIEKDDDFVEAIRVSVGVQAS